MPVYTGLAKIEQTGPFETEMDFQKDLLTDTITRFPDSCERGRSTVYYKCGLQPKITRAEADVENECDFNIDFTTPVVCTK